MRNARQAGFVPVSLILNVVLGVLLLGAAGFSVWAYMNYMDQKNNVDSKIAVAVTDGKAAQQKVDQANFEQQEKLPTRQLVGPTELGAVAVNYPKTWSVYVANNGSGSQFEAYLYPGVVPPLGSNTPYALRVSVVNQSYPQVVAGYSNAVKSGDLVAAPITAEGENGVRMDGKISQNTSGAVVLFQLRDKTLKVYTETPNFVDDFNKTVLPSLQFNK